MPEQAWSYALLRDMLHHEGGAVVLKASALLPPEAAGCWPAPLLQPGAHRLSLDPKSGMTDDVSFAHLTHLPSAVLQQLGPNV